jgi:hypothetical protein
MTAADVDQPWQVWLGAGTLALAIHALALAVLPGRSPGAGGQGLPPGQGVLVLKGMALPAVELRAAPPALQAPPAPVLATAPVATPARVVSAAPAAAPTLPPPAPLAVAAARPTAAVTASPATSLAATVPSAAAVPIPSSLVATTEAPAPAVPPSPVPGAAAVAATPATPSLGSTAVTGAAAKPAIAATVEETASPSRVLAVAPTVAATAPVPAATAPVRVAPATAAISAAAPPGPAVGSPVTTLRPATVVAAATPSVGRPVAGARDCGLAGPAAETFCTLLAGVPVGAEGRSELGLRPADGVFFANDYLVVTVRLPVALGAGHLYVSYLDHTGEIVHLRPNALSPETEVPAGARLRIGADADQRAEGVRDWRFDPPFGQGLIIAWLTRRPLALFPRPEVEPAGPFLAEVKEALTTAELVWAAHRPLESRPRS